jgi:long-subunit fatty acid transport protein
MKKIYLIASMALTSTAYGAGFENPALWSGQNAGQANAVVSSVSGSQSIYFNPAGLAGQTGSEVSVNFSPTELWFSGPLIGGNSLRSKDEFAPVFGVTGSYAINSKLTAGIGVYTSGGGEADYNPVNLSSIGLTPADLKGDVSFEELSVGLGYEILPGLKIGAAWRAVYANASLSLPSINPANLAGSVDTQFNNLSQFNLKSYKVGILWSTEDKVWGAGVDFRSNASFNNMTGTFNMTSLATGTTVDQGSASTSLALPSQLSVGVTHAFSPTLRMNLQYDLTNYSEISSIPANTVGPVTGSQSNPVPAGWSNLSTIRIGGECTAVPTWAFRAGYVYSSQIIPAVNALPVFTAPGRSNTFDLGVGKALSDATHVDVALGYNHGMGQGYASNGGSYADSELAIHTGATVAF